MLNALQRPQHREWLLEQAEALLVFARKARQPLGFAYLDKNGEPDFGQPIQAWISCRMTHIYSIGALMGMEGCREMAEHGIRSLLDLTRPDVTFINRQRGAGTRVLLDFELARLGIKGRQVQGYERQEYTHLAVAAAVASGTAGCGLGILAAARALRLDFVPLFNEQYDLVIPRRYYYDELLAPLLAVIRSEEFAVTVDALGGYDTAGIGQVIAEM